MRCREEASRQRSCPTRYCCRANSCSSRASCSLLKMVRTRLALPGLALNRGKQHLEIRKPGGNRERGQGGEQHSEGSPLEWGPSLGASFLERQEESPHLEVCP